jgi:aspartyl-tRNA(Asn)/glutamyl-tRNA(Gln) amidotransferase subunit A
VAELWELPLVELASSLRAGEVGAEEACHAFLARAQDVDRQVNCFVALDGERALERARALDGVSPGAREALHGVPFAAKDIFVSDGGAPTAGTHRMGLRLRATGATVMERLEDAGAVELGRLNLDPWGYAATGANRELGDTLNPWDPGRIAGGSSSGSAAAVAGRALPFSIGADTGGSVRIPASLCGVVGLKPTFGRIPRRGSIPLSYAQDTIGILARTAQDVAFVLDRVAGYDARDAGSLDVPVPRVADELAAMRNGDRASLRATRIGVDRARLEEDCSAEAVALVGAALTTLESLGAQLVDVDLSGLQRYDVAASVLTQAESAAVHGPAFLAAPDEYPETVRTRLAAALACLGSDHVDAMRYQGLALRELLDGPLAVADVLVAPAAPGGAPSRALLNGSADGDVLNVSLALLRLHRPFNFTGVPALSLPVGHDGDGMPVGMQLVARPWAEARVLACAAAYQSVTSWHTAAPAALAPTTEGGPSA